MFLLLILTMVALPCAAETRVFDVTIEGTSSFVHFMQGYVIAPGSVDFSGLRFEAFDPRISHNKDSMKGGSTIDNTYRNYDLEDSVVSGSYCRSCVVFWSVVLCCFSFHWSCQETHTRAHREFVRETG